MKSKSARMCMALLASMGFSQSCDKPLMYGPPADPFPDPQDTTVHAMYGVLMSEYEQTELTAPAELEEAEEDEQDNG